MLLLALLSDDIDVDDRWNIPFKLSSTNFQTTWSYSRSAFTRISKVSKLPDFYLKGNEKKK